jgi:hypothetical protein
VLLRLAGALLAGLVVAGCAAPAYPVRSQAPTVRCLGQPGRGEDYGSSRPLFFIFCAESP